MAGPVGAVPPAPVAPSPVADRLPGAPRPASTTLSFVLLVALITLTGSVIGTWMRISLATQTVVPVPSFAWVAVPPLAILLTTAVVTALEPRLVIRRRRLEPVPPQFPGAVRFAALAGECGVRPAPLLLGNPDDGSASARSVGRPARYLVLVSPVLLGMARRRRVTFDIIIRHELAHVRSGDVGLATFTLRAWHVTVAAMTVPLVTRLWWPDLSLLPSYLARAAVLAAVVYAVRAQLLRLREHYADVAATPTAVERAQFAAALAAVAHPPTPAAPPARRPRRLPRWLALHPTPAGRAAVVSDPALLGRPSGASVLAAGFVAGAGQAPVVDLLVAAGIHPLTSGAWARALLWALAGAVAVTEVQRAAAVSRSGARRFGGPAVALVAGAALGALTSMGATGLEPYAGVPVAETLVIAVPIAALVLALADAAVGRPGPRPPAVVVTSALLGALASALAALLWSPVAVAVGKGWVSLGLVTVLLDGGMLPAFAFVVLLAAGMLMWWGSWVPVLRAATSAGAIAVVAQGAIVLRLGGLSVGTLQAFGTSAASLTLAVAVGVGCLLTLRHGAAAGVVAAAGAAVVAFAGFAGINAASGVTIEAAVAADELAWWVSTAVLLGVPAAAAVALVRRPAATR